MMQHRTDSDQNRNVDLWHALPADDVLSLLGAQDSGLSGQEAQKRLEEHGPNQLPREQKPSAVRRLLRQFKNILIYILLVAAVFTALLGEWVDTSVIVAVVLITAAIGFIQEGRAEQAMESIRGMLSPRAKVLRDGEAREIAAEQLVPGDVVMLSSGDRVPADVRILYARHAQADEAALTGESEPVNKQADPVVEGAPLGDRKSMAYASTLITAGRLQGVVTATGHESEIGRISKMVSEVEEMSTPLMRRMDAFGRALSLFIVLLSIAIFLLGYFLRGLGLSEMVMAVVSLAVAAIPQGLPAIITVTLALGVQTMAKRNAVIRRLPAVETLGAVTVICSDKTGTLTRNEMTVAKVATTSKTYAVDGVGYRPEGAIRPDGSNAESVSRQDHPWLFELVRAGLLANEARLRQKDGNWTIDGTPTEGSLVVLARKAGLIREAELKRRPRLDVIPFASERRFMASLHRDGDAGQVMYVHIVAMTGDGVNDAPALKGADVGVAMGIKGSEAGKEASEIVLADDNFATIERAVEQGRTIYDNLVKTILFILPTNGAEALVVISSVLILFEVIPVTPLQILWVNMVTAVTLAVSLSFEPSEKNIMRRPPRPPDQPIISTYLVWRIVLVSVLVAGTAIWLFNHQRRAGATLAASRTLAVNALVAGQLFYLFNSRFILSRSLSRDGILGNKKSLIAAGILVLIQVAFTHAGPLQDLFGTASISFTEWGLALGAGLIVFLVVETEKALMRGWRRLRQKRR